MHNYAKREGREGKREKRSEKRWAFSRKYLTFARMKLSILIPTFNETCVKQVEQILEQLPEGCEIIVADDGSTDEGVKATNRAIVSLPHCRLWEAPVNMGRAAIRNRLVGMAKGEWVLLLDAAIEIGEPDFLVHYLHATESGTEDVFVGAVIYPDECEVPYRLRWKYEREYRRGVDSGKDRRVCLRTCNCLIRRKALLEVPLDESIKWYGYEDTLLGEELLRRGYTMRNVPFRVLVRKLDRNKVFLKKMHEANLVLRAHASSLQASSRLLQTFAKAERLHLVWAIRLGHKLLHRLVEHQLCSERPSITLFQLWRLGDYCCTN